MKLYTIIRNTPKEMRKGLNSLIILWLGKYGHLGIPVYLREFLLIFRAFYKRPLMNVALGAWQVLLTSRTWS